MKFVTKICNVIFALMFWSVLTLVGLNMTGAIHTWEKAHHYPYGRMCDPNLFNLYVSTCK